MAPAVKETKGVQYGAPTGMCLFFSFFFFLLSSAPVCLFLSRLNHFADVDPLRPSVRPPSPPFLQPLRLGEPTCQRPAPPCSRTPVSCE